MIDPTTMLAIAAGSTTTAGAALLAVIVLASRVRALKASARAENRKRLEWLREVTMPEIVSRVEQPRIPKGQPGAGRYTKETTLAG